MDVERAERALQEVRVLQERALRAAYPRLPWWSVTGRGAIIAAMGPVGDLSPSGMAVGMPVTGMLGVAAFSALGEFTERRIGAKVRTSRHSVRSVAVNVGEIVAILVVFALAAWGTSRAGTPIPVTLACLVTGLFGIAIAQPVQKARSATMRY
ncbi:hypothetical protein AB0L06_06465 [Spirillospora sp. NPDC052269]